MQKYSFSALSWLSFAVLFGLVACGPKSTNSNSNSASPKAAEQGGSATSDENSKAVLANLSQQLASMIKGSTPAAFKALPEIGHQASLLQIVTSLELAPTVSLTRGNQDLLFAADSKAKVPVIRVLKGFFTATANDQLNTMEPEKRMAVIKDLQEKLLVEVARLVLPHTAAFKAKKASELELSKESESLAAAFMHVLQTDVVVCSTPHSIAYPVRALEMAPHGKIGLTSNTWVVHRSTGQALFFGKGGELLSETDASHEHTIDRNPVTETKLGLKGCLQDKRFDRISSHTSVCDVLNIVDYQPPVVAPRQLTYSTAAAQAGAPSTRAPETLTIQIDPAGIASTGQIVVGGPAQQGQVKIPLQCHSHFHPLR